MGNTFAEIVAYWNDVEAYKRQTPSAQMIAFARTLSTDDAESTRQLTEHEAITMLEKSGIQYQVVNEKLQALSVWSDNKAGGGIGSEWVDIVYRYDWLRGFLGF